MCEWHIIMRGAQSISDHSICTRLPSHFIAICSIEDTCIVSVYQYAFIGHHSSITVIIIKSTSKSDAINDKIDSVMAQLWNGLYRVGETIVHCHHLGLFDIKQIYNIEIGAPLTVRDRGSETRWRLDGSVSWGRERNWVIKWPSYSTFFTFVLVF